MINVSGHLTLLNDVKRPQLLIITSETRAADPDKAFLGIRQPWILPLTAQQGYLS